ncbi:hypothetical protein [Sorangium sp. So ce1153]|uniref:hypothetical protein n=1 Tax=Sorangium sp. So ce1153 TaxID=3133333 RepID=UPI003F61B4A0
MFIRRYVDPSGAPFYEIEEARGYLSMNPEIVPQEGIPEQFASLDEAFSFTASRWGLPTEAFVDPRQEHTVEVDFEVVLRSGRLDPLYPRMPRDEVTERLGPPDAVTVLAEDRVCWLYGSVQLHFDLEGLLLLEIDGGVADFTGLRFTRWFLDPASTRGDLEQELVRRNIPHRTVHLYGSEVIEIGSTEPPRFHVDFDEENVIHALYWNIDA